MVADGFLQLPQCAFVRTGFFVQWEHQHKFAGGGGGELNGVQMGHVPFQQFPHGRLRFLLLSPQVILFVPLTGLTGIQRQNFQRGLGAEKHGQGADAAPDDLRGQDGEVVRLDLEEDPLSGICHDAVGRHADDAHELPCRLPLAQFLFLFTVHGSSLHS